MLFLSPFHSSNSSRLNFAWERKPLWTFRISGKGALKPFWKIRLRTKYITSNMPPQMAVGRNINLFKERSNILIPLRLSQLTTKEKLIMRAKTCPKSLQILSLIHPLIMILRNDKAFSYRLFLRLTILNGVNNCKAWVFKTKITLELTKTFYSFHIAIITPLTTFPWDGHLRVRWHLHRIKELPINNNITTVPILHL